FVGVAQDHAGVGEHRVDMAELGHAVVERGLQRGLVAHVGCPNNHVLTGFLDQTRRFLQVVESAQLVRHNIKVGTDIDADNVGAFLGACHRMRSTLTPCRTSDENHSSVKHSGHNTTAFTFKSMISASLNPNSFSSASVCSPWAGARRKVRGVSSN